MKVVKLCFILPILIFASSCTFVNPDPPYGVWESKSPNIVMDVDPAVGDIITGQGQLYNVNYTPENDEAKNLLVVFSKLSYQLHIGEFNTVCENGQKAIEPNYYFIGDYTINDDKLTVIPSLQPSTERTVEEIVFTKTKDYELPPSSEVESSTPDMWYGIELESSEEGC